MLQFVSKGFVNNENVFLNSRYLIIFLIILNNSRYLPLQIQAGSLELYKSEVTIKEKCKKLLDS